nr:uncharacterized protein LOC112940687 [Solanum lycopersicum]
METFIEMTKESEKVYNNLTFIEMTKESEKVLHHLIIKAMEVGKRMLHQSAEQKLSILTLTLLEKKMASFAIEDFVGSGSLQGLLPKLLEEGWDDVPTLKTMNADDMNELNMTQRQKDALDIRSYLHNRALMQYADTLEESGKSLPELLKLTKVDLTTVYGMKRGHVARFTDRTTTSAGDTLSEAYNLQEAKYDKISWKNQYSL